jgi:hypothetical protein
VNPDLSPERLRDAAATLRALAARLKDTGAPNLVEPLSVLERLESSATLAEWAAGNALAERPARVAGRKIQGEGT